MENKKKELYIFLHINKCAGTTLREHIRNNLKDDEFLLLYKHEKPIFKKKIGKYIKSLTKEKKDKIKIIFGHRVYYSLHKLFPDREVRYITFLRNPVDRTISHYNFTVVRLKYGRFMKEITKKRLIKQYMENGRLLNFKEWFLHDNKI